MLGAGAAGGAAAIETPPAPFAAGFTTVKPLGDVPYFVARFRLLSRCHVPCLSPAVFAYSVCENTLGGIFLSKAVYLNEYVWDN